MDSLRAQVAEKKSRWAQEASYHSGRPQWGSLYGYSLLPPYPEAEVAAFEALHGIRLLPVLRDYLTEVSRETFAGAYPTVVSLYLDGECRIPEGQSRVDDAGVPDGHPGFLAGMMLVSARSTYVAVKGTRVGSVWRMGGGGAYLNLRHGSLMEHLQPGSQW